MDLHTGQKIMAMGRPATVVKVGPQQSEIRFTGERDSRIISNSWASPREVPSDPPGEDECCTSPSALPSSS